MYKLALPPNPLLFSATIVSKQSKKSQESQRQDGYSTEFYNLCTYKDDAVKLIMGESSVVICILVGLCVASLTTSQTTPFESVSSGSVRAVFSNCFTTFSEENHSKSYFQPRRQTQLMQPAGTPRQRACSWSLFVRSGDFRGDSPQPLVCDGPNTLNFSVSSYRGRCSLQTQEAFTYPGSFAAPSPSSLILFTGWSSSIPYIFFNTSRRNTPIKTLWFLKSMRFNFCYFKPQSS